MNGLRIVSPSRLHFGLLGWGPELPRQFGGVGLMIERPGLRLAAEFADEWQAVGPLAERTLRVARQVATQLETESGHAVRPLRFTIEGAPPEHVGLGTGTQLSLAVARAVSFLRGQPGLDVAELARLTGRGLRSGIGLHGFARGGLILDGGRRAATVVPPALAHFDLPTDWSVLLVLPDSGAGLSGIEERRAFAALSPLPTAVTDRLCRRVLLELLPAVAEADIVGFGRALGAIQAEIGRGFATVQGGTFAGPTVEAIVAALRVLGLHGVGQSSWGPTLYAFSQDTAEHRASLREAIIDQFGLEPQRVIWTRASLGGAEVEVR